MITAVVPYRATPERAAGCDHVVEHLGQVADEVLVVDDGLETFSRAASINLGVDLAEGDTIIVCDADLICPVEQLDLAVLRACLRPTVVLPFNEYLYMTPGASRRVLEGAEVDPAVPVQFRMFDSVGGVLVTTKKAFEKTGGFDPRFRGWGGEDYAFHAAATAAVGVVRDQGPLYHLWHPVEADRPDGNMALMGRYTAAKGSLAAIRTIQAEVTA